MTRGRHPRAAPTGTPCPALFYGEGGSDGLIIRIETAAKNKQKDVKGVFIVSYEKGSYMQKRYMLRRAVLLPSAHRLHLCRYE